MRPVDVKLDDRSMPIIMTVPHAYTVPPSPTMAPSRSFPPEATELPRLTARQQQILDWIRGHMEATGMPPTRAEIATGLGFSTASSAEDHLQALAKKGALELTPGA